MVAMNTPNERATPGMQVRMDNVSSTEGVYITLFQRYMIPFSEEFASNYIRPAGNGWFHIEQEGCDEIGAAAKQFVDACRPLLRWWNRLWQPSTLPDGHGQRYHGSRVRR